MLRLIALEFVPDDQAAAQTRIESADAETLDRWVERSLTAQTLDDLFA